jgi:hypothetical protein
VADHDAVSAAADQVEQMLGPIDIWIVAAGSALAVALALLAGGALSFRSR